MTAPARGARLGTDERRRLIVDACIAMISTKGYSNSSIREIAAEANISSATLLHHFGSKEELLVETLITVSDDFQRHARSAMTGVSDPVERLRALARAVLASPRHDAGWRVWMAFWHEAALNPRLLAVATSRNDLWQAMIAGVIEHGRTLGAIDTENVDETALELAALINGLVIQRYSEDPARWRPGLAEKIVNRAIDALVAETEPSA